MEMGHVVCSHNLSVCLLCVSFVVSMCVYVCLMTVSQPECYEQFCECFWVSLVCLPWNVYVGFTSHVSQIIFETSNFARRTHTFHCTLKYESFPRILAVFSLYFRCIFHGIFVVFSLYFGMFFRRGVCAAFWFSARCQKPSVFTYKTSLRAIFVFRAASGRLVDSLRGCFFAVFSRYFFAVF